MQAHHAWSAHTTIFFGHPQCGEGGHQLRQPVHGRVFGTHTHLLSRAEPPFGGNVLGYSRMAHIRGIIVAWMGYTMC